MKGLPGSRLDHGKNKKSGNNDNNKNRFRGVTGSRKITGSAFKAAARFVDVFLGRVDRDATENSIREYIAETFEVDAVSITKLDILSQRFNAYKINVKFSDREKLFQPELWPEDVVIDKFYQRSKRANDIVEYL